MSFDYDTIRVKKQSGDSQWASYSDLFMVLAFIFLLMYMVASLRTGMVSITTHAEVESVKKELKLYESIKTQYLAKQANPVEQQIYQQVIDQISLLESEASENKQRLQQEFQQQQARESALNQYQQMIVSLINANAVAKAEAHEKLSAEVQQNFQLTKEIRQKADNVATLESQLELKASQMSAMEKAHSEQTSQLEGEFERLEDQYHKGQGKLASLQQRLQSEEAEKSAQETRHTAEAEALESKFEQLKQQQQQEQSQIASLEEILKQEAVEKSALASAHQQQTQNLKSKLEELSNEHSEGQVKLASLEQKLATEAAEKASLKSSHSEASRNLQSKIEEITGKQSQAESELAELEQQLKAERSNKQAIEMKLSEETENLQGKIQQLAEKHNESQNQLASLQGKLSAEAADKARLESTLEKQTGELNKQLKTLGELQDQSQSELADLEKQLSREAAEKAALENASAAEIEALEDKYKNLKGDLDQKQGELAALEKGVKSRESKIAGLEKAHADKLKELGEAVSGLKDDYAARSEEADRLAGELGGTQQALKDTAEELEKAQSSLADTSKELGKALELAKRRQDVARQIQDNFKEAGIGAEVDSGSGDVVLDFGRDYFDTDSFKLKSGMIRTIRKAIPVYAQSLFATESDIARISSVEIVGFASPTYGGELVDPQGLSEENREAVNYNLDLSYARARSIFDYVFDPEKLTFDHQQTLLSLIKVTGRSFFSETLDPQDTGNLTKDEFCKQYNCFKSQRVIIKFGLAEKGET